MSILVGILIGFYVLGIILTFGILFLMSSFSHYLRTLQAYLEFFCLSLMWPLPWLMVFICYLDLRKKE
jgi:hypothetical protein